MLDNGQQILPVHTKSASNKNTLLLSHIHTHTQATAVSSNPVSSLYHQQQRQQHSIRTKLLRGRGLVAQVLPIEMQTLWYGNWQLQKPARIHTSMHWNHLRNVRWDGTSSQDNTDKWTKPACLGASERRSGGGTEKEREREGEGWRHTSSSFLSLSFFEFLPSSVPAFCFSRDELSRNAGSSKCNIYIHQWNIPLQPIGREETFCLVFKKKKKKRMAWHKNLSAIAKICFSSSGGETISHTAHTPFSNITFLCLWNCADWKLDLKSHHPYFSARIPLHKYMPRKLSVSQLVSMTYIMLQHYPDLALTVWIMCKCYLTLIFQSTAAVLSWGFLLKSMWPYL